jgi:DNA polymerase-4
MRSRASLAMEWPRAILHLDMDAFFVNVHLLDHPEDRGLPLAIGGKPGTRGVVASASYEARQHGVRSAMPATQAQRRCPELKFAEPDWERIEGCSREVMRRLAEFGAMEPLSVDEAFIDLGESVAPAALAPRLRKYISSETKLPASVGLATCKLVAKVASDFEKPEGCTIVPPGGEAQFLAPLPVRRLYGVGPKTGAALGELGIETCGELAQADVQALLPAFGSYGAVLRQLARGIDTRPVDSSPWERKQISTESTFAQDVDDREPLLAALAKLCEQVAGELTSSGRTGRTVTLKLRWADFTTITRQRTLPGEIAAAEDILRTATVLLDRNWEGQPVRLLGIGVSRLGMKAQTRLGEF